MSTSTYAGVLKLAIAQRSGKNVARSQFHEGALRILRPHYLDGDSGHLTYTVVNPGGAYFGADSYLLDIELDDAAALTLTTQSATKVYRTPQGPAVQEMNIRLGRAAYFEYVPDQLIVYREGEYRQKTDVLMDASSTLVLSEVVTPGWSPEGTLFAYEGLSMRTEIRVTDGEKTRRLALDYLRVKPSEESDISGVGVMEGFSHTGQLFIANAHITDELIETVHSYIAESETCSGLSVVGTDRTFGVRGLAVRSLAHSTAAIATLHEKIINDVRQETAGLTPLNLRK